MSLRLDHGAKYRQSAPKYIVVITQPGGANETSQFWDTANVYDNMVKFVETQTKNGASGHVFTRHFVVTEKTGVDWRAEND